MCCILENNQTEEGVRVPKALVPFMGGMEFLPYNKQATETFWRQRKEAEEREAAKKKKGGVKGKQNPPAKKEQPK